MDVLLSLLVEVGPFQEGVDSMQWIPHQGGRFLVSSYHKTLQDFTGAGWLFSLERHLVCGVPKEGGIFLLDNCLGSYFQDSL